MYKARCHLPAFADEHKHEHQGPRGEPADGNPQVVEGRNPDAVRCKDEPVDELKRLPVEQQEEGECVQLEQEVHLLRGGLPTLEGWGVGSQVEEKEDHGHPRGTHRHDDDTQELVRELSVEEVRGEIVHYRDVVREPGTVWRRRRVAQATGDQNEVPIHGVVRVGQRCRLTVFPAAEVTTVLELTGTFERGIGDINDTVARRVVEVYLLP